MTPTATAALVNNSYLFYGNAVSSVGAPSLSGDGVNLQSTFVQFKDQNSPIANSQWETLTQFITRRVSTNDRINIFNNDLCINKAINTFDINLANNPAVGEIRTTNIKAYMVYPANISITELRDLSVAPGVLGEFVSTSNYLNVTGATTTLPGNTYTAGTPYQALTISGVPYRILQFPPTAGGALGTTGSYMVTTCN